MRFTNGYWLTKPEYKMSYAVESYRVTFAENCLKIIAPARHVADRGEILNEAALEVVFSAPMAGVIKVQVTHFKGERQKKPDFPLQEEPVLPVIEDDAQNTTFRSGSLCAKISKAPHGWQADYLGDGRLLTSSGYHGMAHAYHRETGRAYMSDSLMLDVGEWVYGFGERFTPYLKNGQTVDMWNEDGGTSSEIAYKNVPFYMTSRGYGVFVDSPSDVSFEVASEKVERVQFSVEGETLSYYVIYGPTPKEVLRRYTWLTGRPALPPAWSFGLWLTTSFTTSYDEKTTSSFIQGMADWDIPLHVFHFDCYWMKGLNWCDFEWDSDTFPDPQGIHTCIIKWFLNCWKKPVEKERPSYLPAALQPGDKSSRLTGVEITVPVTYPWRKRSVAGYPWPIADLDSGAMISQDLSRLLLRMCINDGLLSVYYLPIAVFMVHPATGCPGCLTRKLVT